MKYKVVIRNFVSVKRFFNYQMRSEPGVLSTDGRLTEETCGRLTDGRFTDTDNETHGRHILILAQTTVFYKRKLFM